MKYSEYRDKASEAMLFGDLESSGLNDIDKIRYGIYLIRKFADRIETEIRKG